MMITLLVKNRYYLHKEDACLMSGDFGSLPDLVAAIGK